MAWATEKLQVADVLFNSIPRLPPDAALTASWAVKVNVIELQILGSSTVSTNATKNPLKLSASKVIARLPTHWHDTQDHHASFSST